MRDNVDTDTGTLESRYRAHRGQDTLNIELGITNQQVFNSNSVSAGTGGGGGSVSGAGVLNSITGGTSPGGASCPEIHQFTYIRGENGKPIVTTVNCVEVGNYLWNPFTATFEKVIKADVIEDVDLWHVSDGLVGATGSASHPLIQSRRDQHGTALNLCESDTSVPFVSDTVVYETRIDPPYQHGKGTVKHLETEGPTHIYCAGSSPTEMFAFHNLKPGTGGELE